MNKHTQEPWALDLGQNGWIISARHGRDVVASADHDQPLTDREIGDARLMAAAPRMAAALGMLTAVLAHSSVHIEADTREMGERVSAAEFEARLSLVEAGVLQPRKTDAPQPPKEEWGPLDTYDHLTGEDEP